MRFFAGVALALALAGPAGAQTGAKDELSTEDMRRASGLFDSTMSPFCPGRTLNSCPSGKATAWRDDIRAWVAEGLSNEQILARLQARVPDFQLEGTPPTDWSWAGPLVVMAVLTVAFALGGLRTVRARREAATPPVAAGPVTPPSDRNPEDPDRQLLERELQRFD